MLGRRRKTGDGSASSRLALDDPAVQLKLDLLSRALPASDAIVFGDMWVIEGAYTQRCLELGCERVTLVDNFETPGFVETRAANPGLNFYKGDFSDALFMESIRERYEVGVLYDILLHQPPLLHTLHLMLSKVGGRICFVQPMLREAADDAVAVYLPGNPSAESLHPLGAEQGAISLAGAREANPAHWIWGLTPSFMEAALAGEGFDITHRVEIDEQRFPNPRWFWWGCIAERTDAELQHWSRHYRERDLRTAS
ncbi:MAG TPA: hypothetical protein VH817_23070 [Thermoleophilaceae bacterium]